MPSAAITLAVEGQSWRVGSTLPDGKHDYLYATADHSPEELGFTDQLKVYLDVTPGLNLQLVVLFLDAQKHKISHVLIPANRNQEVVIPPGTDRIRFGLRVYASGQAEIQGLVLGHKNLQPAEIIGQADHLLLTNQYPSYEDLYRNGFVHTRVAAYAARGTKVDVFRLRPDEAVSYHEFEDVNVISGSQEVLHRMLSSGRYKSVLVHFLDEAMWQVLQHHIERIKVIVWVHGAEIQPWHRREFDHQTQEQRAVAQRKSERTYGFLARITAAGSGQPEARLCLPLFCGRGHGGCGFPDSRGALHHNSQPDQHGVVQLSGKVCRTAKESPVDPTLCIGQICQRSECEGDSVFLGKPWFYDMEFRMIGDGPLFEETLAPLREFTKRLYRTALSQSDRNSSASQRIRHFPVPDTHGCSGCLTG